MKNKLITNGVLSAFYLIGIGILIAGMIKSYHSYTYYVENAGHLKFHRNTLWIIGLAISLPIGIASLVMGIITLTTMKENKNGLIITSGILALFGGCWGANIIISYLAVKKLNKQTQ